MSTGIIIGVMKVGDRRHRRVWQAVAWFGGAAVAASVLYAAAQLSHGGLAPQDTAGLLGLPLGAAALLVSVLALRKPPEGNTVDLVRTWAATLASQVANGEGHVYGQLLGDDHVPIDLAYTLQPAPGRTATAPPGGRLLPTPATASALLLPPSHPVGGVPDVAAYWRDTRPQRLVVTGPAGAGKTVFGLALILALLKDRSDTDPVPVRIPVSLWDTTTPLAVFVTRRLIEDYGWPKTQAAALVDHGMILPMLDGLDEMDSTLPDGTPDPTAPRARAVLQHLDGYRVRGEPGPLVLTCRTVHLQALADRGALRDSAHVALAPVTPANAVTYLTTRAQDQTRWRSLIVHLAAHPTGDLATLLSTPWRLCLVATVYHREGDPHELTAHTTAQDLDEHLLARFIPAATRLHPHPRTRLGRQRTYSPAQVHRWLHHLTQALTPTTGTATGSHVSASGGTDVVLHELWPLAGSTRVRIVDATLTASATLLALPLAWTTRYPTFLAIMISGIAGMTPVMAAMMVHEPPSRLSAALGKIMAAGLAFGLVFGLAIGLIQRGSAGLMTVLVSGLTLGLVIGLVLAVLVEIDGPPSQARHPRALLRDDLVAQLVVGLAIGSVFGIMAGLTGELPVALVLGLATALPISLTLAAARRYTVFLLCSTRRLPFHLAVFLDWACAAGLLRYSGAAYQFRHRELQQWLALHPDPATTPP